MIKAYLVGISTPYENEDIQILYRIYQDEELLSEKKILKGYQKPLVVSHVALLTLLKELKKYIKDEIIIVINDAALNEQIRGTFTTKKAEVVKMANKVRDELKKFNNSVTVKDVSSNHAELMKWNDELNFGF
ncbi:hypothetical protein [Desulforamulus aeronauticus]|uniref:Uncharacterized protein n=1 Tax=Desulforamulus aeronauticus DSM 10349 TaxID=1121421 RepID=A0A1M6Q3Q8_9FIRM|nr:hypothetical protein [Desulforamulus aeronauticus]SHK14852.1 hypothetical protein SAMN02745123_00886 [Desulforamulus aeronauticus DSM 10349]